MHTDATLLKTGDRGFGLKTMVPLYAGQFVMEYRGEVRCLGFLFYFSARRAYALRVQIISRDESYKRVLTTYKGAKSYYFLDYDGHEVIDAVRPRSSVCCRGRAADCCTNTQGQKGNSSRFINHS